MSSVSQVEERGVLEGVLHLGLSGEQHGQYVSDVAINNTPRHTRLDSEFCSIIIHHAEGISLPLASSLTTTASTNDDSSTIMGLHIGQDSTTKKDLYAVFPNLWVSFVPWNPAINPNYKLVKKESNAYMMETLGRTLSQYAKPRAGKFPLYAAIQLPTASAETLRTCADWYGWVFEFDDQFDEDGIFIKDPEKGIRHAEHVLSVFSDDCGLWAGTSPLKEMFASLWMRFKKGMPKDAQELYIKRNTEFIMALIQQMNLTTTPNFKNLQDWFNFRRDSIGVLPGFTFALYVHGLTISRDIIESDHIREMEYMAIEIILLTNDILSYPKEGPDHMYNTTAFLKKSRGLSTQEAFDEIGLLLDERFKKWDSLMATLPSWGEENDRQVQLYLDGVKGHVSSNTNWSFMSQRFFGRDGQAVKETRRIKLTPELQ
ncbi:terpenoid synthase [Rhizodiscina lignyota]|uniref:Terpene synthase n=1 Tax=Rhizodiscina lignyota TaxID=1504668 RepID=A0A9P4ING9_9PEZI|nr:terpenoid synthase [Rhizodiscina lignyota]